MPSRLHAQRPGSYDLAKFSVQNSWTPIKPCSARRAPFPICSVYHGIAAMQDPAMSALLLLLLLLLGDRIAIPHHALPSSISSIGCPISSDRWCVLAQARHNPSRAPLVIWMTGARHMHTRHGIAFLDGDARLCVYSLIHCCLLQLLAELQKANKAYCLAYYCCRWPWVLLRTRHPVR